MAQVVLNRARSGRWPRSICGVVNQGTERGEKCQFSYACRIERASPAGEQWARAQDIARDAVNGRAWLRELLEATHYHTTAVSPVWRLGLEDVGTFGDHIFYRSPDIAAALSLDRAAAAHPRDHAAANETLVRIRPVKAIALAPLPVVARPRPARVTRAAESDDEPPTAAPRVKPHVDKTGPDLFQTDFVR